MRALYGTILLHPSFRLSPPFAAFLIISEYRGGQRGGGRPRRTRAMLQVIVFSRQRHRAFPRRGPREEKESREGMYTAVQESRTPSCRFGRSILWLDVRDRVFERNGTFESGIFLVQGVPDLEQSSIRDGVVLWTENVIYTVYYNKSEQAMFQIDRSSFSRYERTWENKS